MRRITRWFSFRRWITIIRKVMKVLGSRNIPVKEKLIFLIPVALYWVLPDALPLIPLDDLAVTLLLVDWFSRRIERKYPHLKDEFNFVYNKRKTRR